MKCLLLLTICVLYPIVNGGSGNDVPSFEKILEYKCNQSGPNAMIELTYEINNFHQTISNLLPRIAPPEYINNDDFQHLCTPVARRMLDTAFVALLDKMKPCLSQQQQYMHEALPKIYNDTMNQYCQGDDFKNVMEIIELASTAKMCRDIFEEFRDDCFYNMILFHNIENQKYYWEKEELCQDVKYLPKCATTLRKCSFIYSEGVKILTKSLSKWCNSQ